jgi:hypothetical protein
MSISFARKIVVACAATALLFGSISLVPHSIGQETVKKGTTKQAAKLKGRLPPYFANVVTEKQRGEIYAIQANYDEQLEALKAQMRAIVDKRDAEIEGLLTTEQKTDLATARTAAESKRKKKADAAKKTVESEKKSTASGK